MAQVARALISLPTQLTLASATRLAERASTRGKDKSFVDGRARGRFAALQARKSFREAVAILEAANV
ncbi:MAG: hypothetical protein H0U66_07510 [Gemmatimonadaceae bacterium]|nr:hypothetical protein [Gemmatimonadaceae bacterium]